jgi:hypothetical protein
MNDPIFTDYMFLDSLPKVVGIKVDEKNRLFLSRPLGGDGLRRPKPSIT